MPLIALIVGVSILLMKEKEYFQKEIKMTREEAIDTLKNGLWWDRKQLDEAIDIAVSALRPISRECGNKAAKKIVQKVLKND